MTERLQLLPIQPIHVSVQNLSVSITKTNPFLNWIQRPPSSPTRVLSNVYFELNSGQLIAIMGSSGISISIKKKHKRMKMKTWKKYKKDSKRFLKF
jgi:ABC-type dipeptide/oligopeptide/nickel transport system ATPase subunit